MVEIGPGAGAITGALAARAGHVLAVELDTELAAHLRTQFPADRVTVMEQDVLHYDFAAASAAAGERLRVVGNLPYYITSQILLKLAASHQSLDRAILMAQREVADRPTTGHRAIRSSRPCPVRYATRSTKSPRPRRSAAPRLATRRLAVDRAC